MFRRGFTLVELMISLGILMIVSSLMLVVTGSGRVSWSVAAAKLYLTAQERQASTIISQELMLSRYIPASGASLKFNIPLVDSDTGDLKRTSAGDLKWGDGETEGNYIEYVKEVDANNLLRRILNSSSSEVSRRVIARDVQSFNVTALPTTRQYQIVINFSIDRYLGGRLPSPISSNTTLEITPMN